MDERHYPAEHLNIGIANGNLGWAMIRSRQYQKANEHLQIACDIFAKQLGEQDPQTLDCHKKLNVTLPIVLRLEGTNVEEGRKILEESGLKFSVGATMKEAADIVVAAAKGGK